MKGDWFEPVRGKRFDLIVVNPAIIITPDNTVHYGDSRLRAPFSSKCRSQKPSRPRLPRRLVSFAE